MEYPKIVKHGLTTFAVLVGVGGSFLQAIKARKHAGNHRTEQVRLEKTKRASEEIEPRWIRLHECDAQHFGAVGILWYVVAFGAFASVAGEAFDFFIDK